MFSEPNWLDLEDELYPTTLMTKFLCFMDPAVGSIRYPVQVIYNSLHREIDLTDALTSLISHCNLFDKIDFCSTNRYDVSILDHLD